MQKKLFHKAVCFNLWVMPHSKFFSCYVFCYLLLPVMNLPRKSETSPSILMHRSHQHRETDIITLPKAGLVFSWLHQGEMPALDKMFLVERLSASSLKNSKK